MLDDALKAFLQLSDWRFLRVVLGSSSLAAVLFVGLVLAVFLGLLCLAAIGLGWLAAVLGWMSGLAALAAGIFLFPAVAVAIQGFFLESVAASVERRHYPGLGPARAQPMREAVTASLALAGGVLGINLLLLPIYWLAPPPFNLAISWSVNGLLLGREYFRTVAQRRLDPVAARALRRAHRGPVWRSGICIAALMTVPLLHLAAPTLGTAFMLHRFERLRRTARGDADPPLF